jgi:hypothetical protein
MEKQLFPFRELDPPLADLPAAGLTPPMDRAPEEHSHGGCGCGGQDMDEPHVHGNGCGHTDRHRYPDGCGCVGYEGCGPDSWGLCEYPLAIVYSPCQVFRGLYDPDTALSRGTLFGELDLPLGGEGGLCTAERACRGERRRV